MARSDNNEHRRRRKALDKDIECLRSSPILKCIGMGSGVTVPDCPFGILDDQHVQLGIAERAVRLLPRQDQ